MDNKLIIEDFLKKLKLHNEYNNTQLKYGELLEINGVNLSGIEMIKKDINSAILFNINFDNANLEECDMYGCYLVSSSFNNANLSVVNLNKANLDYTSFINAVLTNITGVRASFFNSNLERANLSYSDLRGVDLREANLRKAVLIETNLEKADFTGANMYNTDLRGAKGIESTYTSWIDVGKEGFPRRLKGTEMTKWLLDAVNRS